MLGMKAFGARPAPKNYADGGAVKRRKASGPVRGPGTGISDEVPDEVPEGTYIMPADSTQAIGEQELAGLGAEQIPVNLSNGEFKLPPEQVHAVGVQTLDQMRDATHTPAAQQGAGLGMKPELFFADGGVVDDEEKRRQTALQPSPSSPSSTYPGNRFPAYDGRSTQPKVASAGLPDAERESLISQIPTDNSNLASYGKSKPDKPLPPDAAQIASDREMASKVASGFVDGAGNLARAAGDLAGLPVRAAAGVLDTAAVRPMRALGLDVGYISPHLVPPGVDPSSMTPFSDAKKLASAAGEGVASVQPKGASSLAPGATPQTQSLANAEEMQRRSELGGELPAPRQLAEGVYQHGRGQYSDSAKGMGFAEGFTGRPSAQNMAAASNLAAQQQRESMGRVLAQQAQAQQGVMQPRGFNAPQPKHSGNDWEARNNLRSLRMAAERAMEDAPRKRFAAQHPAVIAYQQAQQADMQARGGQLDADLKTQEVNAAMQREQMQQQGASQRDAARLGLDQQRLALDERKSASEIRSADRQEKLYQRYEAAAEKGDAKGMAAVAQQIRELKGSAQEAPWKFQVTPATKNVDGSTSEGNLLRYNPQTGAYEVLPLSGGSSNTGIPTPQSKAEYDALPKGAQYIKDGKTLIKG